MQAPELLMPAGSIDVLKTAVRYGADAVYIGGEAFGLRAHAKNFSNEELFEAVEYAHGHSVKVYITSNIFAHESDLDAAAEYFELLEKVRPDGVLISDPGLFELAKEHCPSVPIHISTQANNTNSGTLNFWYKQGVRRVVLARELSLEEISKIRLAVPKDMELEAFVHGAMCMSYSGRCLLSNFFTGRDANRGDCAQACRWKYHIVEETRPGEYMPVVENERGTFVFNSKDLCMIKYLPELIEAGVDSLKVEGRMKNELYVAQAARAYRLAIDEVCSDVKSYEKNRDKYFDMVSCGTMRPFTTGFFFGRDDDREITSGNTYTKNHIYIGTVSSVYDDVFVISQKNKFFAGDELEIVKTDGRDVPCKVITIKDKDGAEMESAPHPGEELHVRYDAGDVKVEVGDILRLENK